MALRTQIACFVHRIAVVIDPSIAAVEASSRGAECIRPADTAREDLLVLCAALGEHDGVTHWAVSKRFTSRDGCTAKGDFFHRLMNGGGLMTTKYHQAMVFFSDTWPDDLEWPADIPRPAARKEVA